jgi:hypothetical protein
VLYDPKGLNREELARLRLEEHGVVLVKDASANKGGVTSSSLEVYASLALSDEEFRANMVVGADGKISAFRKRYVEQILAIIRANARAEFELMWREHQERKIPLALLSNRISERINATADAIATSGLVKDFKLRRKVLSQCTPAALLELVGIENIMARVPENYGRPGGHRNGALHLRPGTGGQRGGFTAYRELERSAGPTGGSADWPGRCRFVDFPLSRRSDANGSSDAQHVPGRQQRGCTPRSVEGQLLVVAPSCLRVGGQVVQARREAALGILLVIAAAIEVIPGTVEGLGQVQRGLQRRGALRLDHQLEQGEGIGRQQALPQAAQLVQARGAGQLRRGAAASRSWPGPGTRGPSQRAPGAAGSAGRRRASRCAGPGRR